jgi:FAD/FMN-containing dehydrogenase
MTLKTRARSKFSRAFGKNFQDTLIIRLLYSRDIVALPSITKLVVSNIPDGVVLIKEIEDIVKVFQIANEEKIPVIPRLGATSGFGGCLPYKKGVVVDLARFFSLLISF